MQFRVIFGIWHVLLLLHCLYSNHNLLFGMSSSLTKLINICRQIRYYTFANGYTTKINTNCSL